MAPKGIMVKIPLFKEHISCICAQSRDLSRIMVPRNKVIPLSKRRPIWVISGKSVTGTQGSHKLDMNSYLVNPLCGAGEAHPYKTPTIINNEPLILVTAQSATPVILTVQQSITMNDYQVGEPMYTDVLDDTVFTGRVFDYKVGVEVTSWKIDGTMAPNIIFSWLFFAEAALLEILM